MKYREPQRGSFVDDGNWDQILFLVTKLAKCVDFHELQHQITLFMEAADPQVAHPTSAVVSSENQARAYLTKETLQEHDVQRSFFQPPPLNHGNNFSQSNGMNQSSFENLDDQMSDIRSRLSASTRASYFHGSNREPMCKIVEVYFPYLVSEDSLLKSLPYTLLGITSKTLPIHNDMTIEIPENMTNGDTQLLHDILEASLLFQYLNSCIQQQNLKKHSRMKKYLLKAISEKLQNYMQFINAMFPSVQSLRELYYKLYWKILELRFYNYVLSLFAEKRGDEILIILEEMQKDCFNFSEKFNWASEFVSSLKDIYVGYLLTWLTKGELPNDFDSEEFFIQNRSKQQSSALSNLRLSDFYLEQTQLPHFLFSFQPILGNKYCEIVFSVGNSLLFLLHYCHEYRWVNDFTTSYSQKYKDCDLLTNPAQFIAVLNEQNETVCIYIESLLKEKYYLVKVAQVIQQLLLMGNSKFIDILVHETEGLLEDEAQFMQGTTLTTSLKSAIAKSSFRNMLNKEDRNMVLNRIDARILEVGHGSIGWNVFTLDYIIPKELEPIFSKQTQRTYLKLFNFFWRLKRVQYLFAKEWNSNNAVLASLKKLAIKKSPLIRDIVGKVSRLNCCKNIMHQFLCSIESYLKFFLVDANFQECIHEFETNINDENLFVSNNGILLPKQQYRKATKPKSLDELRGLQEQMLQRTMKSILINTKDPQKIGKYTMEFFSTSLIRIFSAVLEFLSAYSELNEILYTAFLYFSSNIQGERSVNNLSKLNEVLLKVVRCYGEFDTKKSTFVRELKIDGSFEAVELSKMLHG
ncbi:hypothetical protein ACO0RG_001096 [Hanseniaspora osmophila]|uniref:Spindle pole body component n=1 Tax=Hanseniaspora osmophila TaxID=56408 RepID=A0A1E5RP49_9ASCO|nr:Spindle pole body component SPC98 [Hanseniaspora osmophila]